MSQRECHSHHERVHYYTCESESDGVFSTMSEQHVDAYRREDDEHAYCCHDEVEVGQVFGRLRLDDIIAFHIGCTQKCHQECEGKDFNCQLF